MYKNSIIITQIFLVFSCSMGASNVLSVKEKGKFSRFSNDNSEGSISIVEEETEQSIIPSNSEPPPINTIIAEKEDIDDFDNDEYIKFIYINENKEEIETEIKKDVLSEIEIQYFKKLAYSKKYSDSSICKRFGSKKFRMHWDIDFREENYTNELDDLDINEKKEDLMVYPGSLTRKQWFCIRDINIVRNLDPTYLSKDEYWPREYTKLLGMNKILREGKLYKYRAAGALILIAYFGVESFLIYATIEYDVLYFIGSVLLGCSSILIVPVGYWLLDPYCSNIEGYCNENNLYRIEIKEPSKCQKKVYCMKKVNNYIPGTYKQLGCFYYPACFRFFVIGIKNTCKNTCNYFANNICNPIKNLCCRPKKVAPIKIQIASKPNKITTNDTIELKIGEN